MLSRNSLEDRAGAWEGASESDGISELNDYIESLKYIGMIEASRGSPVV